MEVSFEQDLIFTGGHDGAIFKSNISEGRYEKIWDAAAVAGDSSSMVTCLSYSPNDGRVWYGTP